MFLFIATLCFRVKESRAKKFLCGAIFLGLLEVTQGIYFPFRWKSGLFYPTWLHPQSGEETVSKVSLFNMSDAFSALARNSITIRILMPNFPSNRQPPAAVSKYCRWKVKMTSWSTQKQKRRFIIEWIEADNATCILFWIRHLLFTLIVFYSPWPYSFAKQLFQDKIINQNLNPLLLRRSKLFWLMALPLCHPRFGWCLDSLFCNQKLCSTWQERGLVRCNSSALFLQRLAASV